MNVIESDNSKNHLILAPQNSSSSAISGVIRAGTTQKSTLERFEILVKVEYILLTQPLVASCTPQGAAPDLSIRNKQ